MTYNGVTYSLEGTINVVVNVVGICIVSTNISYSGVDDSTGYPLPYEYRSVDCELS